MGDVYCSPKFKCGEDLDKALIAALSAEDNAERAEAARVAAERGVASKPNLLDNWYFVDPVNQRGQMEYTSSGYTLDRWRALNDMSVSLGKQGLTLEMAFGQQFTQFLEDYSAFDGKSLTASVLFADNTLASGTIVYDDSAADWIPGTRVFFSAKNIQFIFTHDHGFLLFSENDVDATIVAMKLEFGTVQTLAHQDENGTWVLNDPPPNKGLELLKCVQSTADSSDTYANKVIATGHLPNHNLLDNWYFGTPINQRGQTVYSASTGYTIDRWRATQGTLSVDGNGITYTTAPAEATQYICHLMQYIESGQIKAGRKYTFSILTKEGQLLSATSAFPVSAGTTLKTVSANGVTWYLTFALSSNGTHFVSVRRQDTAEVATIGLVAAKLELGSVQTLAYQDENGNWVLNDPPPNKQQELAKCQRYFERITAPGGYILTLGLGIGSTERITTAFKIAPKRIHPTFSYNLGNAGGLNFGIASVGENNATKADISTTVSDADTHSIVILRYYGAFTAGQIYQMGISNGAYIDFSADL